MGKRDDFSNKVKRYLPKDVLINAAILLVKRLQ